MPATIDPVNTITILAALDNEPRSGYEIKRVVRTRLEGLGDISSGTIYYTLKKLESKGWIKGSVSRRGRRPERKTFRITPAGKRGLQKLLEEAAMQDDRFYSPFDVAVFLTPYLSPDVILKAVDRRIEWVEKSRRRIEQVEEKNPGRWPFYLYYLREKFKEVLDTNERWCQRLKKKIQEKALAKV